MTQRGHDKEEHQSQCAKDRQDGEEEGEPARQAPLCEFARQGRNGDGDDARQQDGIENKGRGLNAKDDDKDAGQAYEQVDETRRFAHRLCDQAIGEGF